MWSMELNAIRDAAELLQPWKEPPHSKVGQCLRTRLVQTSPSMDDKTKIQKGLIFGKAIQLVRTKTTKSSFFCHV